MVFIKGQNPFESEIVSTKGVTLVVKNASTFLPANGRRRNGKFSKLHGHRSNHPRQLHWQDADYIAPVDLDASASRKTDTTELIEVVRDKQGNAIGYKIGKTPFSTAETKAILLQLQVLFKDFLAEEGDRADNNTEVLPPNIRNEYYNDYLERKRSHPS
jgi:hypothetical protein